MINNNNECFCWCHIRHLNPRENNPQRIKKVDKAYIEKLDYSGIEFPVTIQQVDKTEKKNNININVSDMMINNDIQDISARREMKIR